MNDLCKLSIKMKLCLECGYVFMGFVICDVGGGWPVSWLVSWPVCQLSWRAVNRLNCTVKHLGAYPVNARFSEKT